MAPLFVIFACIFALYDAAPQFERTPTEIISVNSTEYLNYHPNAELIPLEKTVLKEEKNYKLRFTLGKPGDSFFGYQTQTIKRSYPKDIYFTFDYKSGEKFNQTLTHLEIEVVQDSPDAKFFIEKGRLGQSFVEAVLFSHGAQYVQYYLKYYGH